jgi:selenocysteine lyase/cysteine desulfurase
MFPNRRYVLVEHAGAPAPTSCSRRHARPPGHRVDAAIARLPAGYDPPVDAPALIETIRRSVIGDDEAVAGPFGVRRVTYADYTASGRSLSFIEDYLRDAVLPLYANTHTESSGTGLQTTRFRAEARQIVKDAVGATDEHVVVFVGSGSTAAIDRLVHVLGLRLPAELDERYGLAARIPAAERPVVFIGPYEHHSNELPWRESIADVITIPEDADGRIDLARLEVELLAHADRPLKIGSFSAASNVTGILSDTRAISVLLHRHGALSFWDFAASAPYVEIEMAPRRPAPGGPAGDAALDTKDAIFISPHKLIGGPGTPGILVARRDLFRNRVPTVPGGGTVAYVNPTEHVYLDDVEHREEGGTPAIVESIRAGLVFQLKEAVGVAAIREREEDFIRRAIERWRANPALEILGNPALPRLSIVSFVVRHRGRYLHHNYVVALLNDLLGIQARGGCSCAGPYGHRLLGIDLERSHEFEREISRGCEGIKPGWIRVNLNYFISEAVFDFVIEAVDLVAREGWRLLPHYRFDPLTGLWRHRAGAPEPPLSLLDIRYEEGAMRYAAHRHREPESRLGGYLEEARALLAAPPPVPDGVARPPAVGADFEHLRWFWLPAEAADQLAAEGGVA